MASAIFPALSIYVLRSSSYEVFYKDLDLPVFGFTSLRNWMVDRRRMSRHIRSMAAVGRDGVERGMAASSKPAVSVFLSFESSLLLNFNFLSTFLCLVQSCDI